MMDILQALAHIGSLLAGGAALWAIFLARGQLKKLNDQVKMGNTMAILEIEFELNRRKEAHADKQSESEKFIIKFAGKKNTNAEGQHMIKILDGAKKEALENYLNIFERLCNFIINKHLNEEDFRIEYRDMLSQTVDAHINLFGNNTKYRNMLKLYNRWKDS